MIWIQTSPQLDAITSPTIRRLGDYNSPLNSLTNLCVHYLTAGPMLRRVGFCITRSVTAPRFPLNPG